MAYFRPYRSLMKYFQRMYFSRWPFSWSYCTTPPPPPPPLPPTHALSCATLYRVSPMVSELVSTDPRSSGQPPQTCCLHSSTRKSLGRMLGPFQASLSATDLQINRFGVIPKGHQPGKWRLITDLSFPSRAEC